MKILRKADLFQKEIDVLRPFEGEMLEQIKDYYRVGLTWTSNALEGNSLTESETKVLLEDGLTVGGKPLRDIFEAVDHARAYDFMFSVFGNRRVDEYTVLRMHELFYQNIEPEYAGRYRDMRVIITGSRYSVAAPEKIPEEMGRCVSGYRRRGTDTILWNLLPSFIRDLCSYILSGTGTAGWQGSS